MSKKRVFYINGWMFEVYDDYVLMLSETRKLPLKVKYEPTTKQTWLTQDTDYLWSSKVAPIVGNSLEKACEVAASIFSKCNCNHP